ncbi:DUF692 domain-containing protein [Povalibacter sp.]|uniref:MNIO family bufferin maturase n=1 Tax=Povalibacter sp. TaxID=1962978 RepID=UPI002F3E73B3
MPTTTPNTSLGFGLGLRPDHYEDALQQRPAIDWFEVISENYMIPGGRPLHYLDRIRERYPLVMHGVSLSIGSTDALNRDYLRDLKSLARRVEPAWISDHLCWTGVDGTNLHDLMPLPYTDEALLHVSRRVREVQDFLGRRILLENVSSYVSYSQSRMQEWEFLAALCEEADCELLLDVNNIYVSSVNHGFDAHEFLAGVPVSRVRQMHLAGHTRQDTLLIDTHDQPVPEAVWDLYRAAVRRFPNVSTMIERDSNIPPLAELVAELDRARKIAGDVRMQVA